MKKFFLLLVVSKHYVNAVGFLHGAKTGQPPVEGTVYNVHYYSTLAGAVDTANASALQGNGAFIFELKQLHQVVPVPVVVETITVTESD